MKQPTLEERVAGLEKNVVQLIMGRPVEASTDELTGISPPTLEARVAALEKHVIQLLAKLPSLPQPLDWRNTVGIFANDPVMREIQAEGQRIREEDRRRTIEELDGSKRRGKGKPRRASR
jgi:hypothetical protein